MPRTGTLANRMLSARDVAAILAIPERTVRDKWREWGLAYAENLIRPGGRSYSVSAEVA